MKCWLNFSLENFNFINLQSIILDLSGSSKKVFLISFLEGQVWLPESRGLLGKRGLAASNPVHELACNPSLSLIETLPHMGPRRPDRDLFSSLQNRSLQYSGRIKKEQLSTFLQWVGARESHFILILSLFSFPLEGYRKKHVLSLLRACG